jgi:hypothetical protein
MTWKAPYNPPATPSSTACCKPPGTRALPRWPPGIASGNPVGVVMLSVEIGARIGLLAALFLAIAPLRGELSSLTPGPGGASPPSDLSLTVAESSLAYLHNAIRRRLDLG